MTFQIQLIDQNHGQTQNVRFRTVLAFFSTRHTLILK